MSNRVFRQPTSENETAWTVFLAFKSQDGYSRGGTNVLADTPDEAISLGKKFNPRYWIWESDPYLANSKKLSSGFVWDTTMPMEIKNNLPPFIKIDNAED